MNNLGIKFLEDRQANKEVVVNSNFALLSALLWTIIKSKTTSAPPSNPSNGDTYIVPEDAKEEWSGYLGNIAVFVNKMNKWFFLSPYEGLSFFVIDENIQIEYKNGEWHRESSIDSLNSLGIGTSNYGNNVFACQGSNILFNADKELFINHNVSNPDKISQSFSVDYQAKFEIEWYKDDCVRFKKHYNNDVIESLKIDSKGNLIFGSNISINYPSEYSIVDSSISPNKTHIKCLGSTGESQLSYIDGSAYSDGAIIILKNSNPNISHITIVKKNFNDSSNIRLKENFVMDSYESSLTLVYDYGDWWVVSKY